MAIPLKWFCFLLKAMVGCYYRNLCSTEMIYFHLSPRLRGAEQKTWDFSLQLLCLTCNSLETIVPATRAVILGAVNVCKKPPSLKMDKKSPPHPAWITNDCRLLVWATPRIRSPVWIWMRAIYWRLASERCDACFAWFGDISFLKCYHSFLYLMEGSGARSCSFL